MSFDVSIKINSVKLYDTNYVICDKNYENVHGLDTIFDEDSIYWELLQGTYTEEEIEDKMKVLKKEGEVLYDINDTLCDWKWVSMTQLPKRIQKEYLNFYRNNVLKELEISIACLLDEVSDTNEKDLIHIQYLIDLLRKEGSDE
tara:strand:- start:593 stop:1024 length:432 start_codon:yes stop_codon:yes gene_type:complete